MRSGTRRLARRHASGVPWLLLAACWTGEPHAETPLTPGVTARPGSAYAAPGPRHAPSPRPRRTVAHLPQQPPPTPERVLAARLRSFGPSELPTMVTGPVVVLDLDTASFTTLCGPAALLAARDLGVKLADPGRQEPICTMGSAPKLACVQVQPDVVALGLEDPDQPRLISAIVGAHGSLDARLIRQLAANVAAASCP